MNGAPRWLELEVEIGMARERLRQIQRESQTGTALDRAIDDATGRTQAWLEEARELAEYIDAREAELTQLTGCTADGL